jgi:hypothetical protein
MSQESKPEEEDFSDLIFRLKKRAEIRASIPSRKSVQEGKPDRLGALLLEAAAALERLTDKSQLKKTQD